MQSNTLIKLGGGLKRKYRVHVHVRGKMSSFRGPHLSGHCYFSLKDDQAWLEAVIWRRQTKTRAQRRARAKVIASGKSPLTKLSLAILNLQVQVP